MDDSPEDDPLAGIPKWFLRMSEQQRQFVLWWTILVGMLLGIITLLVVLLKAVLGG